MGKERIGTMYDKNDFTNAGEEFSTKFLLLQECFFTKPAFLKCKESRKEAFEEWRTQKDIPKVHELIQNLSEVEAEKTGSIKRYRIERGVNCELESNIFNDCDTKSNNMLKPGAEPEN